MKKSILVLAPRLFFGDSSGTSKLLITADSTNKDVPIHGFNKEKFPKEFNKKRLALLLQKAVDKMYLKGFRYLGDTNDFDHGHILFVLDKSSLPKAVAILYHTQEQAYDYHEKEPESKYDYLNPNARNWIQWLDMPEKVENARQYERTVYPFGAEWDSYKAYSVPAFKRHFTVHQFMLDPKFLGGEVAFAIQWGFYKIDSPIKNQNSNVIKIKLPRNNSVSLALLNESYDSLLYPSADFDEYLY